jgi:hypothetical protein
MKGKNKAAQPGAAGDLAMLWRKLIKIHLKIPGKMVPGKRMAKRLSAQPLGFFRFM